MKVLRIIPSMNPSSGGPCRGIRNIIPELEKLGIYNEVVCLDAPLHNFLEKDGFTITSLGPSKGAWQYSPKLIPWLLDNLSRFDVVIVHALWLYHGYAFYKAFKKYKKLHNGMGRELNYPKFFVMPHGMLDPYFQQASERKIKAMRNWAYWKLIESKLVNNADGLLFTCKMELLLAREPFRPYHPKQEINIGYGVEPPPPFETTMCSAFHEKCPQVKDQPFILFLSRIHEKKGIDHLIEAYGNVLDNMQGHKKSVGGKPSFPKLVIAGPGLETPYGKKMQQLVSESGTLQESVFFPGMLTGNAKWGAFYLSEAFILPSHQENFGIAVVEALACGKPVLISNQVNIWREIIEVGGGVVEEDTTAGTQKLLEAWLRISCKEKKVMGDQALSSYINNFSIIHAAKRFSQLVVT